jgi:hypothetical protein
MYRPGSVARPAVAQVIFLAVSVTNSPIKARLGSSTFISGPGAGAEIVMIDHIIWFPSAPPEERDLPHGMVGGLARAPFRETRYNSDMRMREYVAD